MTRLIFIDPAGTRHEVEATNGTTVMENAIKNDVPGILAECGGACACATCHIYVAESAMPIVGQPAPMEEDMLDFATDIAPTSRLSCQIKVTDELDGVEFTVPASQG